MAINNGSVSKEGTNYRQVVSINIDGPIGGSVMDFSVHIDVVDYTEFEDGHQKNKELSRRYSMADLASEPEFASVMSGLLTIVDRKASEL